MDLAEKQAQLLQQIDLAVAHVLGEMSTNTVRHQLLRLPDWFNRFVRISIKALTNLLPSGFTGHADVHRTDLTVVPVLRVPLMFLHVLDPDKEPSVIGRSDMGR
ncbi:MAG: hypothetical protein JW384_02030 [Nitrosomonadaceae bacterium]|nr:hypothetical protein [Nitrosomonadaceae bacterium]